MRRAITTGAAVIAVALGLLVTPAGSASPVDAAATGPAPASWREPQLAPTAWSVLPRGPVPRTKHPRAWLAIPSIGVRARWVVRYGGSPDDDRGTGYQDRGYLASPVGPAGGAAPGEIGSFVVTGHRTSGGSPLLRLPALRRGALVRVGWQGQVLTYRMTGGALVDSSRPGADALLAAAVPGRPGAVPTRASLTLITCATIEDNARGDRYRDRHHNPRHRIVRYGVLVPAPAAQRST